MYEYMLAGIYLRMRIKRAISLGLICKVCEGKKERANKQKLAKEVQVLKLNERVCMRGLFVKKQTNKKLTKNKNKTKINKK